MEILSPVHGTIEYKKEDIIYFSKGIPGFDGLKEFVVKPIEESDFMLLQSIEDKDIGFIVLSPFTVEEKYEIELKEDLIQSLDIKEPEDVNLLSIVTLNSKVENITVNLKAPLVINVKGRRGQQYILDKEEYKTKHPLMKG